MTYFIGGTSHGLKVKQDFLDCKDDHITMSIGALTGIQRQSETYVRTQINFQNEIKTFFIIDGKEPKDFRDEIVAKWDWVKTEIYSLE